MNPDELEKIKEKILSIKHTRIIKDPFPEFTDYFRAYRLGMMTVMKPEQVSIWEAYKKGYEQAYREILENLK